MKKPEDNLTFVLMYLGLLPFVVIALAVKFYWPALSVFGPWINLGAIYGLVIVSFMAGSLWGYRIHPHAPFRFLLLLSNYIAINIWIGVFVLRPSDFLWLTALCFLVLLGVDFRLGTLDILSSRYLYHRFIVTLLVILSLVVMGIAV